MTNPIDRPGSKHDPKIRLRRTKPSRGRLGPRPGTPVAGTPANGQLIAPVTERSRVGVSIAALDTAANLERAADTVSLPIGKSASSAATVAISSSYTATANTRSGRAAGVLAGSQSWVVVEVRPGPDAIGRGEFAPDIFGVTYTELGLGSVKFGHVVAHGRDLRIGPGQPLVLVDPIDPSTWRVEPRKRRTAT